MDHVNFVAMKDGTKEDYQLLTEREVEYTKGTADRLLHALEHLDEALTGYKITRLGHSLQSATRAWRGYRLDSVCVAARYRRYLCLLQSRRIRDHNPKAIRA